MTVLEVLIAACLLLLTSLSMAYAFSASGVASKRSDKSLSIQQSLETTAELLEDQPYHQLLTMDGTQLNQGDHTVSVATNLAQVGLILVELVVTDNTSGTILARLATYRAEGA